MNYIYDILLNLNDSAYDFYEWNLNDPIVHIRKTPIFRISYEQLLGLKQNKFEVQEEFLKKIENKTEEFTNRSVEKISHLFLATDMHTVMAFSLNERGISMKRSMLLVDEEMEILEISKTLPLTTIAYRTLKKEFKREFETRNDQEMKRRLKKEIYKLSHKNVEKLKYLYYECFDEMEEDVKKIVNRFSMELNHRYTKISKKLFTGLDLLKVKF
ncbi:MAG: hypothetical protein KH135_00040 [Firmicutes bacterium]|nr:hypothetical protein [Bacillota bacterium]